MPSRSAFMATTENNLFFMMIFCKIITSEELLVDLETHRDVFPSSTVFVFNGFRTK
mgnify:CR=1 FL=1